LKYIIEFKKFIGHLLNNKKLIFTLIKNDFQKQYLGSYLGLFWAFAQPLTYMVVIWFVFTYGFRQANTSNGAPYFLWLITGMVPWFFFANGLSTGTNAVVGNAFLVKKVAFRVSILPIVSIGSALLIHLVLILFLMLCALLYGYMPTFYWLQIFYYVTLSTLFLIGLSWLTASIRVFIKDISSFVSVVLQIGFWATPIFWNVGMIPHKYHWILNLNPAYYLVEGFRDTFINKTWFWQKPMDTCSFFIILFITFFVGAIVFRRLRPHFGDVL